MTGQSATSGLVRRCHNRQLTDLFLSSVCGPRRPQPVVTRSERNRMKRRIQALSVLAVVALASTACGGGGTTPGGGGDSPTLIVGVDLPFQGSSKDASDDTWNAMQLYLEQVNNKAGRFTVN